jgi:hypothetical protein
MTGAFPVGPERPTRRCVRCCGFTNRNVAAMCLNRFARDDLDMTQGEFSRDSFGGQLVIGRLAIGDPLPSLSSAYLRSPSLPAP